MAGGNVTPTPLRKLPKPLNSRRKCAQRTHSPAAQATFPPPSTVVSVVSMYTSSLVSRFPAVFVARAPLSRESGAKVQLSDGGQGAFGYFCRRTKVPPRRASPPVRAKSSLALRRNLSSSAKNEESRFVCQTNPSPVRAKPPLRHSAKTKLPPTKISKIICQNMVISSY